MVRAAGPFLTRQVFYGAAISCAVGLGIGLWLQPPRTHAQAPGAMRRVAAAPRAAPAPAAVPQALADAGGADEADVQARAGTAAGPDNAEPPIQFEDDQPTGQWDDRAQDQSGDEDASADDEDQQQAEARDDPEAPTPPHWRRRWESPPPSWADEDPG
jgi:hypothetical protein